MKREENYVDHLFIGVNYVAGVFIAPTVDVVVVADIVVDYGAGFVVAINVVVAAATVDVVVAGADIVVDYVAGVVVGIDVVVAATIAVDVVVVAAAIGVNAVVIVVEIVLLLQFLLLLLLLLLFCCCVGKLDEIMMKCSVGLIIMKKLLSKQKR